jgi:4-hydroxythreonine-4-phosphate dehydrogenase
MKQKIKVGITQGDINGVGYEVILKTFEDSAMLELCTPIIYGSAKIASFYRKILELQPVQFNQIQDAADARDGAINIINVVGEDTKVEPGQSTPIGGKAAFAALERATRDINEKKIDVMVTAPINKHNIQSPEFNFAGHTEYLEASAGEGAKALMILATEAPIPLRVALVTTHLPIDKVADALSTELITERIEEFNTALHRDFAINKPRIAVLSLNPHSGDDGLLGSQEQEIIIPAIKAAQEKKITAFGPYSADGFFGSSNFTHFDGILAMYHDQGLAPFKAIAMDNGVNFTAGLPFVRTSPDHGTAYDIAGKGEASADSMRQAIYMAIDVLRHRRDEDYAHRNPLRRQYYEKGPDNVVLDLTKDDDEQ